MRGNGKGTPPPYTTWYGKEKLYLYLYYIIKTTYSNFITNKCGKRTVYYSLLSDLIRNRILDARYRFDDKFNAVIFPCIPEFC